jgi:predicted DNA-binding transcriptional regulator AlpA
MADEFISIHEVGRMVGGDKPLKRATVNDWVRAGKLPKPIRFSTRMSRWRRSEVEAALNKLVAERTT